MLDQQFKTFRLTARAISVLLALMVITVCSILPLADPNTGSGGILPARLGAFLVDRGPNGEAKLFAWQHAMWIGFFWALAELFVRYHMQKQQQQELAMHLLPENAEAVLTIASLPEIHRNVVTRRATGTLGTMVKLLASQFQISRSVSMCSTMLSAETEARSNEIELGYNMVRYLVWMIPTLGFCGTVWGILNALREASITPMSDAKLLPNVIGAMSVAFWTTLLALVMSCIIMWLMHIVQGKEETHLNRCTQYCLRNFINRLYDK